MATRYWIGLLSLAVLASVAVQLLAPGSGLIAALAGLILVIGGTLLTAFLSHSQPTVMSLRHVLANLRQGTSARDEEGMRWFLQAADSYRRGEIRRAEAATQRIPVPLLRQGTQLVLDGFPRDQVTLALQWQIAEERDGLRAPGEVLRAMAGYAPAFGMLGTLLGLVQMLFGLGSGNLGSLGAAMGFAMLTTVYGLILANLVLKPLAGKLDRQGRASLSQRSAQLQAVMMLFDRQHSALIREVMNGMQPSHGEPVHTRQAAPAGLRLIASR